MKKISVIGAGFAGMTLSLRLAQRGFEVDLYEKSSRLGGLLGTHYTEHGFAEQAANALIRSENVEALFKELGLNSVLPLPTSKKRFLFRGEPRQWPLNLLETLCFTVRLLSRLLRGKKSLRPLAGETLKAWGQRNIGASATDYILEPAMQGIYGNEISGLSASLILGPLFKKRKKSPYKGLVSGPQGMQNIVDSLEKKLRAVGVNIHVNADVDLMSLQTPMVLATSASGAAVLLKEKAPEQAALLKNIKMSSLMSVTLFFNKAQETYKGFGCLIPRSAGLKALGILMNSYIFPGRDKVYNETWILGGVKYEDLMSLSDEDLLSILASERFEILKRKDSLLDYRVNRWKQALPYYDLHLEETLNHLEKSDLSNKHIFLHGNYLGGIGLSKILDHSEKLAEELTKRYG